MFATILISVAPRLLAQAAGQSQLQAETNPTLSSAVKVFVREFRFQGNTVFLARELAQVVGHYLQRELDSGELEDARRALTLHYVSKGYVNSGAVLDDQPVTDGVITFRIVEGRLSQIDVRSNAWLRASYIRRRIERGARPPLNIEAVSEQLQLLKENPNITTVRFRSPVNIGDFADWLVG